LAPLDESTQWELKKQLIRRQWPGNYLEPPAVPH
jgi:hypothetical protein